ncbi:MAG: hypothetical protein ACI4TB_06500 [Lachnospiraceae bacterium]
MWECAYGKEPLDLKLLLLRLMKKIGLLLLAGLLGAVLGGGIYFFSKIAGQGTTYEAVSTYYVDYGTDPLTENTFTYINGATWNDVWVKSDAFLASILEKAGSDAEELLGHPLTAEELKGFLTATLETDLRMPITTVKTESPALTMLLCRALEETMVEFGNSGEQKEINSIRIVISPEEATRTALDNRTGRAVILGAILAVFFTLVILVLLYLLDDSIYVPCTFEYRYHIPMLGTIKSVELKENFSYLFADKKRVALLSVDATTDVGETADQLRTGLGEAATDREFVCMPGIEQCPEVFDKIRETEGLLLLVEAGAHDGKRIENTLNLLKKQDITVTAAMLIHDDERLQKAYYLPGLRGGNV